MKFIKVIKQNFVSGIFRASCIVLRASWIKIIEAPSTKHEARTRHRILRTIFINIFTAVFFFCCSSLFAEDYCNNISGYYDKILEELGKKNQNAIKDLPECFRRDRTLILKAVLLDYEQFQYADDSLREDAVFVERLLKISPETLKFAAPELRSSQAFMEKATYLSRDSLQYASWSLLDNKLFMKRMIAIDSRNYKFASDRLKEIPEIAADAFEDNGLLLEFAPPKIRADKKLVKIAVRSNTKSFAFVADELKKDKELQKLAQQKTSIKSQESLKKFLQENYTGIHDKKNLGKVFVGKAKFFEKNKIIDRNYVTKWQRSLNFYNIEGGHVAEDARLIAADSRNHQISWREDFKKYPDLTKKIEKFFLKHNVAANTIENLSTTYLWRVKNKSLTLAFNLYLLRDSTDDILGPDFANITSLSAIAQKRGKKWEMTILQVIFDSEIKVEVAYENGHRHYELWDLYKVNKNDKNPKIIFKIHDRFGEHLEVFEEQIGGKYQMVVDEIIEK